ncbi:aldehyde dehydrogenase (NAD+) [Paenibacillus phyllosphaerae]|uniref:Aldehyde dehydrogenase n=1 Tax=Paenibacillus phyllosphaerae TaxID=274593 RepID=A0A7W5AWX0_9BACL|nr:aldehyde dehydrogenase [Paenibacillus phyllosphaerae]MBB3110314.1 aldehyde dehydrogenase (NAD+) [Paenibacillus phyllosphaerae]
MILNSMNETPAGEISAIVKRQKEWFASEGPLALEARVELLRKLKSAIKTNEQVLLEALRLDLNKHVDEAFTTEIGILYQEINHTLKHLKKWAKPKRVKTPFIFIGAKSRIIPEPYGTALIIAPWNYPVQLALAPAIGAIAAGNTVVIKPSELTPHVAVTVAKLIRETFDPRAVAVVEGGIESSQTLLSEPFDYIFFTGSVAVGRTIMAAAAKQLIPVTLELGGKSPCIVHEDANLKLAARRIIYGKLTNAGQTCVAPDYILVHERVKDALIPELIAAIEQYYGQDPANSDRFGKIVNERHFKRLTAYLTNGRIRYGCKLNEAALKIGPTLLEDVAWDEPVMEDEIFGPILPIMTYSSIEEAVKLVNGRPKPLALYLFTESREAEEKVLGRISFGGGCVNDTLLHLGTPYLPFGGVGESGIGSYHGESSFQTFSHYKSVLKQTTRFDLPLRYPAEKSRIEMLRKAMK